MGILLFGSGVLYAQDYRSYPMWDHKLSFEKRVEDLVSRLSLEEKVAQMLNAAPAVPRLGIPAYDWWNEVLHGVARTPYKVTSYPQAIAMAATWDSNSLYRMADYAALEGRVIHNKAIETGRTNERYLGLTYWTPNINIFRDPRWGRGQETYGEDPFLTAMLARAFVRGLQGEDPKYLKAAACAKHFAVHSGPEPSRHSDNFNPSVYDLWDTYLPAFRELITRAGVAGVMCAYNAVNTQPCCANDLLMNDILRKQWKFTGYVTSDCWAVDDFYKYHKTHKDATVAAADAVLHGTDLECGQTVYKTLREAVKLGGITEKQLDISLKRLFMIRYRLGMFDPPAMVKYADTRHTRLEDPRHKAHALRMAQQSIVLLKNENRVLPLSRNVRKIAVLGPNADNAIAVLGNYNGTPSEVVTVLEGIRYKLGSRTEIIYEKAIQFTNDTLLVYAQSGEQFTWEGQTGFRAEYYTNRELNGTPLIKAEPLPGHNWQEGQELFPGIPANQFSARYSADYLADRSGAVILEVEADDGYRLLVDGKEVINAWQRNRWGARTYRLETNENQRYRIVLEYWQGDGQGSVHLRTGDLVKTDMAALNEKIKDADAIIFVGGISPQLEGEEMRVDYPGFLGGDRTTIQLPAVQTKLMQSLQATGKPLVFVMMTGSAIAIPWEKENVPAILNAWYGGQDAGTAVADVLFGDYNPAGRLPVTFYKSDQDLPAFSNYDMEGRTYRYFRGEALYPFGYGLSYTKFTYSNPVVPRSAAIGRPVKVSVTVTNTGNRSGDEVVQLYLSHQYIKGKTPIRALRGFRRIHLKPGERRQLHFTLTPEDLSLTAEADGSLYQPKGSIEVSLGGGQPGMKQKTTSNVLTKKLIIY